MRSLGMGCVLGLSFSDADHVRLLSHLRVPRGGGGNLVCCGDGVTSGCLG